MLSLLARLAKRTVACGSCLIGWVAFRLGRHEVARRSFERVLDYGGDEFSAYIHLGRIALGQGDFAGYRREMNNARNVDPERFAKLLPGVDAEPRLLGSPFEETGERATWRSVRQGPQGYARRSTVRSVELPTESNDDSLLYGPVYEIPQMEVGERSPRPVFDINDDFLTATERARFRNLPPLRRDDVRTADFDELARRLSS